jgi:signal transduction histidine kinase
LLNALDAVDASGREDAAERLVCVRTCAREGRDGELAVIDTGPGVPSHVLPLIFAPFYSTKIDGLGMGLSVARSIVAAHGGEIRVEKNPVANGAAFIVTFPLRLQSRSPASASESPASVVPDLTTSRARVAASASS